MVAWVKVSAEVHELFLEKFPPAYVDNAQENPDGTWDIPLHDDTALRLALIAATKGLDIDGYLLTKLKEHIAP